MESLEEGGGTILGTVRGDKSSTAGRRAARRGKESCTGGGELYGGRRAVRVKERCTEGGELYGGRRAVRGEESCTGEGELYG